MSITSPSSSTARQRYCRRPLSVTNSSSEMPRVAHSAAPTPECAGVAGTERQAPLANGLVGDRNAPLGQQVLDIPETESEAVIEPDRVADDLRRKPIAVIAGYLARHPPTPPGSAFKLTVPNQAM